MSLKGRLEDLAENPRLLPRLRRLAEWLDSLLSLSELFVVHWGELRQHSRQLRRLQWELRQLRREVKRLRQVESIRQARRRLRPPPNP